ncbi:purine catabolism regulator [Tissierella praeacuta]|uniref:PucR family transcriptional regulator n=1 Tax=Tissierella praeacuta TaxID=43131 RepID=UPI001048BEF7|nr:PucR family transcriptional regulator [Tissierella praeacuta]TCU75512.1 purine catabolism regulator [Tissierella praeacuta]
MGVTVGEVLKTKFFGDYYLIAGKEGLNREIQAVSLFDAPDGYKWVKGKEFMLSSGYLFKDNIELFKEVILFLSKQNSTCLAVKINRYLGDIPKEIIDLCDELRFPLINVPNDVAWIDIINAVNSIVMNRYITHIIDKKNADKLVLRSDDFHKKIEKTIICLSEELNSPLSIVDILEKGIFNYPKKQPFLKDDISFNKEDDFSFNYQKEILCDKLNIYRITNIEDKEKCPFIIMPIVIKGVTVSKLMVWEHNAKIDYYDLFVLRLSYTLLLEIYEQIYLMNSFERRFYDDLIKSLINEELDSKQSLIKAINSIQDFKLNIENKFICICIKQNENNPSFYKDREKISTTFLLNLSKDKSIFGILDDNTIILIYDVEDYNKDIVMNVKKDFAGIFKEIKNNFQDREIKLGIGDMVEDICRIRESYVGSLKAVDIGSYIYTDGEMIAYEDLGPFGLFRLENIQRKDFNNNFIQVYPLLEEPDREELISTLKVYLESESNCNIAAKKLFIHSNTVRYRIAKIQQICNIDLENPIERLKMEITLKFINVLIHKKEF